MASANRGKEQECTACLNFYTDPLILKCGHSFCRNCIDKVVNTRDESGVYSCPECREKFQEWPVQQRTPCGEKDFLSTDRDNVLICCTYCIHSPVPAVKSCLLCEASLCEKHLLVHSKSPKHVLTDPSTSLEKRKCSVHKKVLEYYCTKDTACICVSCCLIGEHNGHNTEPLEKASEKKKKKWRKVLKKLITKREKTEERVQSLEERRRKAQEKASGEAERVTALFIDIRRRLDDLEKRILSEISRREEKLSLSLSDVIQKLEIKKDELSMEMRHIEELCNMTDPLTVLQGPDTGDLCDPEEGGGDEDTGGHDGGDRGLNLISNTLHRLSDIIRGINVTFYVQDRADILLDVNTAGNYLLISDDLKTATDTGVSQKCPKTKQRFQHNQVMSKREFSSGRHYWDVEISGAGKWKVGMCYPSIDRRGDQSLIGNNKKSWGLYGWRGHKVQCSVIHDRKVILIPDKLYSHRVRICLDYEGGYLSFYELCDPIRHLHTFTATFTEPLHAALYVTKGYIKLSEGVSAERSHHYRRNPPTDQ